MVECGLPKPETRVRFPSPAPLSFKNLHCCAGRVQERFRFFQFFLRPYVRTKVREIRRSHCSHVSDRLLVSGQFTRAKVTLVTNDTLVEVIFRQEMQGQGENTATFIYKVKNLGNAEDHSAGGDGELNSNKVRTASIGQFYRNEINATKKI